MSHLTQAGKRCKVAGKEYKCIFHRQRSSKGSSSTRGQRRTSSGGKRRASDPVPWYIAMSGPQKRKLQAALRAEERGEQLNYIPKWGGVRSTSRTGRYGLPRNQYRSKSRRTGIRGRTNVGKIWGVVKTLMKEITGVPFPGEPWN